MVSGISVVSVNLVSANQALSLRRFRRSRDFRRFRIVKGDPHANRRFDKP